MADPNLGHGPVGPQGGGRNADDAADTAPINFQVVTISLKDVPFENGHISAGLAAIREATLPTAKRIPIPLNIFKIQSAVDVLKLSKWAYDKMDGKYEKIGAQLCYWFGAIRMNKLPDYSKDYTKEELEKLDWDTEVHIYDELCPDLGHDRPGENSVNHWMEWTIDDAAKVFGLVFAAKLTWWLCQHHLGTDVQQPATAARGEEEEGADEDKDRGPTAGERRFRQAGYSRKHYGYLEKMVMALKLEKEGYGFDTEQHVAALYAVIHPWSTRWVMEYLFKKKYPEEHCPVVVTYGIHPACEWIEVKCEEDLLMRVGNIGAGYAKVGDLYQAFKLLAGTPIISVAPGIQTAQTLLGKYDEVHVKAWEYGINAPYLCKSTHPSHWDEAPTATLMASLATYMARRSEESSLNHAALFCKPVSDFDGYSPKWDNFVRAYEDASLRYIPTSAAFMQHIVALSGGVSGTPLNQETLNIMNKLHIDTDTASANKVLELINAHRLKITGLQTGSMPAAHPPTDGSPISATEDLIERLGGFHVTPRPAGDPHTPQH